MRHKLKRITKEGLEKLPVSKHSPIDKIDRYSRPFAHHRLIAEAVKEHHEKAIQDALNRFGPDAITNSQEEKQ